MSEEEIYQEMYEEFKQNQIESQREYERYEYERQRESDYRTEQQELQDRVVENCYADYSGGKKPEMSCDYYTGTPSTSNHNSQESVIYGFIIVAIVTIVIIAIFKTNKRY